MHAQTIKQSFHPFWDQTLIFPPITLHGTKEYIKSLPPEVVLQVYDQDLCVSKTMNLPNFFSNIENKVRDEKYKIRINITQGTKEFCGRCIAVPLVKLATETYSPPDFPPKLEWHKFQSQKDCTGSVLAAFELIEVSYPSSLLWAIYREKY